MKRGWYQEKQAKLKKWAIESRKESTAISIIDDGYAGRLPKSVTDRITDARLNDYAVLKDMLLALCCG